MRILFITLVCLGSAYFLFKKRRFDFFSLAFFSAALYFFPGWIGDVPDLVHWATWSDLTKRVPLVADTYVIMSIVLAAVWLAGAMADMLPDIRPMNLRLKTQPYAMYVALSVALIGLILTVITVGSTLLTDDKRVLLNSMTRWHVLWTWGACLVTTMGFLRGSYLGVTTGFGLLALDLYLGFRAPLVLTLLALVTLHLNSQGVRRLAIANKRWIFLGFVATMGMLAFPTIWAYGRAGNVSGMMSALLNGHTYWSAVMLGEPFITQGVLNEVVRSHYHVDPAHLADVFLAFGLFAPDLGVTPTSFNDLFQPALFPQVDGYGLGNNIWAQMYAVGGISALLVFLALFLVTLSVGTYLLRARDHNILAFVSISWVLVAFYLNRNDLLVHVNFEKQLLTIWLLCTSGGLLLRQSVERSGCRVAG